MSTVSVQSLRRPINTPVRAMSFDGAKVLRAVVATPDGVIAASAALLTDLPLLARAIKPLARATHVFAANLDSNDIPESVRRCLGAYAPSLEKHDNCRVWQRIATKPSHLVADSHN
jgi:hypothetical protein